MYIPAHGTTLFSSTPSLFPLIPQFIAASSDNPTPSRLPLTIPSQRSFRFTIPLLRSFAPSPDGSTR